MTGVIEYKISIKKLFAVLKRYESLELVPEGYYYAELYVREKEPYH